MLSWSRGESIIKYSESDFAEVETGYSCLYCDLLNIIWCFRLFSFQFKHCSSIFLLAFKVSS